MLFRGVLPGHFPLMWWWGVVVYYMLWHTHCGIPVLLSIVVVIWYYVMLYYALSVYSNCC